MKKYTIAVDLVATSTTTVDAGRTLEEVVGVEEAKKYSPVPLQVEDGWRFVGENWVPPEIIVPPKVSKFALIEGDVVTGVMAVPFGASLAGTVHPSLALLYVPVPEHIEAGWKRVGAGWEAPAAVEAPVAVNPTEWLIDIGPFFDRFKEYKLVVLMSPDPLVKAIVADVMVRKWVDLRLPEVAKALDAIRSKIPVVTLEMRRAILSTPVSHLENLALRQTYTF